jgi:hypothetical protein
MISFEMQLVNYNIHIVQYIHTCPYYQWRFIPYPSCWQLVSEYKKLLPWHSRSGLNITWQTRNMWYAPSVVFWYLFWLAVLGIFLSSLKKARCTCSVFRDKLSTRWIRYETSLIVWTCVYILHNMDIVVYKLHNYEAQKALDHIRSLFVATVLVHMNRRR